MQDTRNWARAGDIDALLPMLYSAEFAKVELWSREFRADVPLKTKIYPALLIGNFYDAKSKRFDARYLNLADKFNFNGFALFAAQNLTDDLIEKLNKKN
jgi:uncharacterized lipoprotein YddW (UPF0748 family)